MPRKYIKSIFSAGDGKPQKKRPYRAPATLKQKLPQNASLQAVLNILKTYPKLNPSNLAPRTWCSFNGVYVPTEGVVFVLFVVGKRKITPETKQWPYEPGMVYRMYRSGQTDTVRGGFQGRPRRGRHTTARRIDLKRKLRLPILRKNKTAKLMQRVGF